MPSPIIPVTFFKFLCQCLTVTVIVIDSDSDKTFLQSYIDSSITRQPDGSYTARFRGR